MRFKSILFTSCYLTKIFFFLLFFWFRFLFSLLLIILSEIWYVLFFKLHPFVNENIIKCNPLINLFFKKSFNQISALRSDTILLLFIHHFILFNWILWLCLLNNFGYLIDWFSIKRHLAVDHRIEHNSECPYINCRVARCITSAYNLLIILF